MALRPTAPTTTWTFPLRAVLLCLFLAACISSASAQVKNADINPSVGNLPIQKIGLNDLISIQVYDSPELTRTVRISEDGTLRLPLVKEPILAAGLYPPELEEQITKALKDDGILMRPIVSVSIAEYRSRPIRVVGAVKKPVTFQATGNIRLLDAITAAEGLTDAAGNEILVSGPPSANGGQELVQRIDRKQLIDRGDESLNMRLNGGEEVRVPEAGKVWVMGNVKKPGPFAVRDPADMTVMKIVSQAELLPFTSTNAYILRKTDTPKGEVTIPLTKILERKSPDVPLLVNDVLYIPDSRSKRNTSTIVQLATGFGIGTMSGLLIFKH